jgi:hypothetical protein
VRTRDGGEMAATVSVPGERADLVMPGRGSRAGTSKTTKT